MPNEQMDDAQSPPPVRSGPGKRLMLIGSGVLLAGLLLVVVINIDTGSPKPTAADDFNEAIDLVPGRLTAQDVRSPVFDPRDAGQPPVLAAGGWIQVADDEGNLAQQYRCDRLDPNPPGKPSGWVKMDRPRAEFYLSQNRVLTLSGDSALAYLPNRVLESGTITGDVTIRLFEPPPGQTVNVVVDEPSLVVYTDEARFDDFIGEVRCDGNFRIETPSAEFPGRGLTLLINDQGQQVQVTAEVKQVQYIRLASIAQTPRDAEAITSRTNGSSESVAGGDHRVGAQAEASAASATQIPPRTQTPADDTTQFYRLTLHDNVRIQQGDEGRGKTITGETLAIIFTFQSEGLAKAQTSSRSSHHRPRNAALHSTGPSQGMPLPDALIALTLASYEPQPDSAHHAGGTVAPPPRDDDIYITCSGGLTIVPVTDPSDRLESARDARLEVTGRPVHLVDADKEAEAYCDHLVYSSLTKRAELIGSSSFPLSIHASQFEASSDRLSLTQIDGPGNLRQATFASNVKVDSEEGSIACDELSIDLKTDDQGKTIPTTMLAIGDVEASDPDQTIWTDRLFVTFHQRQPAPNQPADESGHREPNGGNVQVESLTANGNVQIVVAGGGRAFADNLIADAVTETAELTGSNVMVVYDKMLLDRGTRVILRRQTETAHWDGPGQAQFFASPIEEPGDGRFQRPHPHEDAQVRTTWDTSMDYDNTFDDGAGAIDFRGNVQAMSKSGPLQVNTIKAEALTLQFTRTEVARHSPDDQPVSDRDRGNARSAGIDSAVDHQRTISRLIARGDAKFENRSWINEDHSDLPMVFYVAGQHIEYDDQTGEALIPGAGELLIRDLRGVDDADDSTPFGGKGTTSFRFKQQLHMSRAVGSLYHVEMIEQVEMRHLSPDGKTATLTCERLEVTIDRPGDSHGDTELDLGGPAEVQRLRAEGDVFLRTPTRDVDCGEFVYDVSTGIAELIARPGQLVTIHTRGTAMPWRLQRAIWDIHKDTLTAVQVAGADSD